jgi:hypothetical protein
VRGCKLLPFRVSVREKACQSYWQVFKPEFSRRTSWYNSLFTCLKILNSLILSFGPSSVYRFQLNCLFFVFINHKRLDILQCIVLFLFFFSHPFNTSVQYLNNYVRYVVESTGVFTTVQTAGAHHTGGAEKVLQ